MAERVVIEQSDADMDPSVPGVPFRFLVVRGCRSDELVMLTNDRGRAKARAERMAREMPGVCVWVCEVLEQLCVEPIRADA